MDNEIKTAKGDNEKTKAKAAEREVKNNEQARAILDSDISPLHTAWENLKKAIPTADEIWEKLLYAVANTRL